MIVNNALRVATLVHGKHDLVEDTTISLYQGSDFIRPPYFLDCVTYNEALIKLDHC